MSRGKAHSADIRARAGALLLAGHRQSEVCEITGLEKTSVSRLAAGLGDQVQQVATKNGHAQESDTDLIMGYFRAALRAMTAQAEVFADPVYCRTQDADKLAISHGVLGDKLAGIAATAQALGLVGTASSGLVALPAPGAADPGFDGDSAGREGR